MGIIASKPFFSGEKLPFWLESNLQGANYSKTRLAFYYHRRKRNFDYGFVLLENSFDEVYLKYKKRNFNLKIGKWNESISSESKDLSSGSLILSKNAKPIPKISVSFLDYSPSILKKNNFFIRGKITHEFLDKGPYVNAPYLHFKNLYVEKIISKDMSIALGAVHAAQWAGETTVHGKQPHSFSDYLRIFFLQPGSDNSLLQEKKNRLGNHLGIWDLSFDAKINSQLLRIYYQHPFEDQSGAKWLINRFDGLYGFEIIKKESGLISNFLYEYINTTNQSGSSGASDSTYGWDNYYNHYIYQSGWTFLGRVIGNPLFTLGSNNGHYSNQDYIINNRIKAHHIGLIGKINRKTSYKILFTYSNNFGVFPDQYLFNKKQSFYIFENGLIQKSGIFELELNNLFKNLNLIISYGYDSGELLINSSSFLFYFNYRFSKFSTSN